MDIKPPSVLYSPLTALQTWLSSSGPATFLLIKSFLHISHVENVFPLDNLQHDTLGDCHDEDCDLDDYCDDDVNDNAGDDDHRVALHELPGDPLAVGERAGGLLAVAILRRTDEILKKDFCNDYDDELKIS